VGAKAKEEKRANEEARVATTERMGPFRQAHEEGRLAKDAALMEGLGAGRFEGHKLGHTGGSNPDADIHGRAQSDEAPRSRRC
jgi:hypothetical protein